MSAQKFHDRKLPVCWHKQPRSQIQLLEIKDSLL